MSVQSIFNHTKRERDNRKKNQKHTINTSIIRLNKGFLYFTIFDDESITLTPLPAEDGSGAVERQIQCFGELEVWIGDETDLFFEWEECQ